MAWKMEMYACQSAECGDEFEFLTADPDEHVECPRCDHSAVRIMSAPSLGFMNNDPEKRKEALKKRSEEHTKREQRRGNLASIRDMKQGKLPKVR